MRGRLAAFAFSSARRAPSARSGRIGDGFKVIPRLWGGPWRELSRTQPRKKRARLRAVCARCEEEGRAESPPEPHGEPVRPRRCEAGAARHLLHVDGAPRMRLAGRLDALVPVVDEERRVVARAPVDPSL